MKFEMSNEDQKIIRAYNTEDHLKKLIEELDELKRATSAYLETLKAYCHKSPGEKDAIKYAFLEEFVDVAIKMRHVYELEVSHRFGMDAICDDIERFKLARQCVRIDIKDETYGTNKQKE